MPLRDGAQGRHRLVPDRVRVAGRGVVSPATTPLANCSQPPLAECNQTHLPLPCNLLSFSFSNVVQLPTTNPGPAPAAPPHPPRYSNQTHMCSSDWLPTHSQDAPSIIHDWVKHLGAAALGLLHNCLGIWEPRPGRSGVSSARGLQGRRTCWWLRCCCCCCCCCCRSRIAATDLAQDAAACQRPAWCEQVQYRHWLLLCLAPRTMSHLRLACVWAATPSDMRGW
jgi:hypothetical protein